MDSIWRRTFSEARRSSQRWRMTTRMPKRAVRANMAASNFQKRCSSITAERQLLCSSLLDLVQFTLSTYPVSAQADHDLVWKALHCKHSVVTTNSSSSQQGATSGFTAEVFSSLSKAAPKTLRDTRPQNRALRTRTRGRQQAMGIRQSLSISWLLHQDDTTATLTPGADQLLTGSGPVCCLTAAGLYSHGGLRDSRLPKPQTCSILKSPRLQRGGESSL